MPRYIPVVTSILRAPSPKSFAAGLARLPLFVCLLLVWVVSVGNAAIITLADAMDDSGWTFTSTGASAWTGQNAIAYDGIDAARSGTITHNGKSTLTTTISGVTKFSFRWRVWSEKDHDAVRFYVDDVEKEALSGDQRDWKLATFSVSSGSHTLRWEYAKDGSGTIGEDTAWVDDFNVLETSVSLAQALDSTAVNFASTTAGGVWTGQTVVSHDGVDAARSGKIEHNGKTTLTATISGVSKFSFRWKVSSEKDNDFARFYIDDVEKAVISGETDWALLSYTVSTGSHILRWEYSKNSLLVAGQDAAWVDEFTIPVPTGSVTLDQALDEPGLKFTSTGTGAWIGQTAISHDGVDSARSGTLKGNEKASLTTTISGVAKFSFRWRVASEKNRDFVRFYIDDVPKAEFSGERDWARLSFTVSTASHTLRWEYAKDSVVDYGKDAAWVDEFTILEANSTNNPANPGRILFGMGDSSDGQLAMNTESQAVATRVASGIAAGVAQIAAGEGHTLFVKTDGTLWAMGRNDFGQLGDGTTTNSSVPVQISGHTTVTQVSAGRDHSLFLKADGTLWGMGSNANGQLGLADTASTATPKQIATGVSSVAAGADFTLYIKTDGSLWGTGKNDVGQLGDKTTVERHAPVQIDTGVTQVAAGRAHTLFLKSNALYATGQNMSGQLGYRTTTSRTTPVQVATGVAGAAAGGDHSLFVKTDGGLWVMGANGSGQLGDGGAENRLDPYLVVATGVSKIAAGESHSLFVKTDGTLWAMGLNTNGQLGDGTTTDRSTPVQVGEAVLAVAAGNRHSLFLKAPATHTVVFDLGLHGTRTGGGPLTQFVTDGYAAIAPVVTLDSGWVWQKWDTAFATVTGPLTVRAIYKQPQTIRFPAIPAVPFGESGGSIVLAPTSSSGLPVQLSVVSGPGTLGTDGRTLTYTDVGIIVIRATQPGNDDFIAATAIDQNLIVNGVAQTITFEQPGPKTYGDAPMVLSATTNAPGLAVTLALVSGPATFDSDTNTLTITGAGNVVLKASQTGGQAGVGGIRYSPATPVERTLVVGKKPLTLTVSNASRAFGENNPEFDLGYSGFVGSDTEEDITTPPSVTTTAKISSPPGNYPIAVSGGLAPNYSFAANSTAAVLTVIGYGGTYEALLFDPGDDELTFPIGKLELTVSTKNLSYSGNLTLAAETAPINFKGTLTPAIDASFAEHIFNRAATSTLPALSLAIKVPANGLTITGFVGDINRANAPLAVLAQPARIAPPPAPLGAGAHTLVLRPAVGLDELESRPVPAGSGHATVSLEPTTANLVFKGKLADGTPLTATLKSAEDRSYRLWINSYAKRAQSSLAGRFSLRPHPDTTRFADRFYVPADENILIWQKAAQPSPAPKTLDATYPLGFGPVSVSFTLDPWLPPVAAKKATGTKPPVDAVTLAQRLGLAANNTAVGPLRFAYGPDTIDLGQSAASLPSTANLDVKNNLVVTDPANNPVAFKISITAATGAFSGSFVLRDQVAAPTTSNPDATKSVARTVGFSGVFRQTPDLSAETDEPIGTGFFLLPGLPTVPAANPAPTPLSGEIRLLAPSN